MSRTNKTAVTLAFFTSVSFGFAGLGQRTFLGSMFAWQLMLAWGIMDGAFSPRA